MHHNDCLHVGEKYNWEVKEDFDYKMFCFFYLKYAKILTNSECEKYNLLRIQYREEPLG